MALADAELITLVSEPDALTTRPPPCAAKYRFCLQSNLVIDMLLPVDDTTIAQ